jgi:hypothetical protein
MVRVAHHFALVVGQQRCVRSASTTQSGRRFAVELRWWESADHLERGAPHARYQVDGEYHGHQSEEETRDADMLRPTIVRKMNEPEEIERQRAEDGDPDGEEQLALQEASLHHKVGIAQEFEGQRQFQQAEVTFTTLSHPPDLGMEFSQPGKAANSPKGSARATLNPVMPMIGPITPPFTAASTSKVPMMGPVHENDTSERVNAMKKMPSSPPRSLA